MRRQTEKMSRSTKMRDKQDGTRSRSARSRTVERRNARRGKQVA